MAVVLAVLGSSVDLAAQDRSSWAPAIEDNSFFIEEAYNQEAGIVQHISNLVLSDGSAGYAFTQEWPFRSQRHQLSWSVPYAWPDGDASGLGDAMLNYRYQLRDGSDWAAIAPRVSLILPTGDERRGLGSGSTGLQLNLPVSRRAHERLAWHLNAGATFYTGDEGGDSWHAGASAIALITPKVNAMLEVLRVDGPGAPATVVSPGLRAAIDVGELQIVPGVAVPVTWQDGDTSSGLFVYLSFEHPF